MLVRGTVCHYCVGGCSALVLCARRSRQVWGVGASAGSRDSPVPPPLPPRSPQFVCRSPHPAVSCPRPPLLGLRLVAPQVRAACPLPVCALALLPSAGRCGRQTSCGPGAGHR